LRAIIGKYLHHYHCQPVPVPRPPSAPIPPVFHLYQGCWQYLWHCRWCQYVTITICSVKKIGLHHRMPCQYLQHSCRSTLPSLPPLGHNSLHHCRQTKISITFTIASTSTTIRGAITSVTTAGASTSSRILASIILHMLGSAAGLCPIPLLPLPTDQYCRASSHHHPQLHHDTSVAATGVGTSSIVNASTSGTIVSACPPAPSLSVSVPAPPPAPSLLVPLPPALSSSVHPPLSFPPSMPVLFFLHFLTCTWSTVPKLCKKVEEINFLIKRA